jgi:hypothetical protein
MLRLQAHLCNIDVFSSAVGAVLQALSDAYDQLPSKTLLRLLIRQTWFQLNRLDSYDSPHFATVLHLLPQLRIQVDDQSQEARFEQYDRCLQRAVGAISRIVGTLHRPGLATANEYDSDDEVSDPADIQRSLLEPVLSVLGLFAHMTDKEAEQYLKTHNVEHTMVRFCLSCDWPYCIAFASHGSVGWMLRFFQHVLIDALGAADFDTSMCILAVLQRTQKAATDIVDVSMRIMRAMHKRQAVDQHTAAVDLVSPLLCAGVVAVWAFDTDLDVMKDILPILRGAEVELHHSACQVIAAVLMLAKSGKAPFRLAASDAEAILTAVLNGHLQQAQPAMDETTSRIFALSDKGTTDLPTKRYQMAISRFVACLESSVLAYEAVCASVDAGRSARDLGNCEATVPIP